MDGTSDEVSFLGESLRRALVDLRRAVPIDPAASHARGQQFTRYLNAAIDGIDARLSDLETQAAAITDPLEAGALSNALRLLHGYVGYLESSGWLESIGQSSVDLGLIYFLEESAHALLPGGADLAIHHDSTQGYAVQGLRRPFIQILATLGQSLPDGPQALLVSYPPPERDRSLLHPIFLHELAHPLVDDEGIPAEVVRRHPDPKELDSRFADVVAAVGEKHAASGNRITPEEVEQTLRNVLESWIREIACDAIAVTYLGPSYLFASAAFLLPRSRHSSSATHPSASLRVFAQLGLIDEMGWRPLLEERCPKLLAWLAWVAEPTDGSTDDHVVEFVRSVMLELLQPIRDVVVERLAHSRLEPKKYIEVGEHLEAPLSQYIPPVQLPNDRASGRREILLAAWIDRLREIGDSPASLAKAVADLDHQRIVAKAIEMSYVLEQWGFARDAASS